MVLFRHLSHVRVATRASSTRSLFEAQELSIDSERDLFREVRTRRTKHQGNLEWHGRYTIC